MSEFLIHTRDIHKTYRDQSVLQGVDFALPRGSVCGLLGHNGSGKTTLLKICLGLIRPSSGSVQVLEENPWQFSEQAKACLGYVPQEGRVYPWLSVGQLIAYHASFYPQWNKALVARLLEEWRVNVGSRMGHLSEGEAQKVMIILALGHEPELLIFDEPVASLDPLARRQFLKTILEIVTDRDCTVFFSTHITFDLERVADRVAVMREGRIIFDDELDTMKEEVKRVRIAGVDPVSLELDEVLWQEKSGQGVVLAVRNYSPSIHDALARAFGQQPMVEDLNLEEIFLELSR